MEITDEKTHIVIVLIYSVSIAFLACLTKDLSLILGIYSSFCEVAMDFFLPATLLYCALKGLHRPCLKTAVIGWSIIGVLYWATAQYFNLKKMNAI
jgi:uncharacterized membrane protein YwaF